MTTHTAIGIEDYLLPGDDAGCGNCWSLSILNGVLPIRSSCEFPRVANCICSLPGFEYCCTYRWDYNCAVTAEAYPCVGFCPIRAEAERSTETYLVLAGFLFVLVTLLYTFAMYLNAKRLTFMPSRQRMESNYFFRVLHDQIHGDHWSSFLLQIILVFVSYVFWSMFLWQRQYGWWVRTTGPLAFALMATSTWVIVTVVHIRFKYKLMVRDDKIFAQTGKNPRENQFMGKIDPNAPTLIKSMAEWFEFLDYGSEAFYRAKEKAKAQENGTGGAINMLDETVPKSGAPRRASFDQTAYEQAMFDQANAAAQGYAPSRGTASSHPHTGMSHGVEMIAARPPSSQSVPRARDTYESHDPYLAPAGEGGEINQDFTYFKKVERRA